MYIVLFISTFMNIYRLTVLFVQMMECGRCQEWVHAQCEGLSNEHYQILSCLPDSVEYVCRLCLGPNARTYLGSIMAELKVGMEMVLEKLVNTRCAKHLVKRDGYYRSSTACNKALRPASVSSDTSKRGVLHSLATEDGNKKHRIPSSAADDGGRRSLASHRTPAERNSRNASHLNRDEEKNKFLAVSLYASSAAPPIENKFDQANLIYESKTSKDTNDVTRHVELATEKNSTKDEEIITAVSSDSLTNDKSTTNVNITDPSPGVYKLRSCSVTLKDINKNGHIEKSSNEQLSCDSISIPSNESTEALKSSKPMEKSSIIEPMDLESESESGLEEIQADISKIVNSLEEKATKVVKPATTTEVTSNNLSRADPKTKINKDIDDDLVSTDESSFCDSDSELESIIEDPDEPKDLNGIKEQLSEHKYDSVLQFHVDVCRVIEAGKYLSRGQTRNIFTAYTKYMKDCFPWFDVQGVNIFDLIDKYHPFPMPLSDHTYAVTDPPSRLPSSPSVKNSPTKRSSPSPLKTNLPMIPTNVEPLVASGTRKCVLCNGVGDGVPKVEGRLLYLGQDEWLHVNCGLWSSEVYEEDDGGLQKVYEAVSRGRMIKCNKCMERGATVGCCHRNCSATYHFQCANTICCQFLEDKRMFCPLHIGAVPNVQEMIDFHVNRCVYVEMSSQKKKWKQVLGNKVNITIGSLTIHGLGKIMPQLDSSEALIPVDFVCSRLYWSTIDPRKRVRYVCRTKRIFPVECKGDSSPGESHFVIDHSRDPVIVNRQTKVMQSWFQRLEQQKVTQQSRETNIIPPHLCPLYREILTREGKIHSALAVDSSVSSIHVNEIVVLASDDSEEIAKKCLEDILDIVCRCVDEENLFFETELPGIVNSVDNELISMVLNDLDACDSGLLQSTLNSSPGSPIELDFLSNLTNDALPEDTNANNEGMCIDNINELNLNCAPQEQELYGGHNSVQSQFTEHTHSSQVHATAAYYNSLPFATTDVTFNALNNMNHSNQTDKGSTLLGDGCKNVSLNIADGNANSIFASGFLYESQVGGLCNTAINTTPIVSSVHSYNNFISQASIEQTNERFSSNILNDDLTSAVSPSSFCSRTAISTAIETLTTNVFSPVEPIAVNSCSFNASLQSSDLKIIKKLSESDPQCCDVSVNYMNPKELPIEVTTAKDLASYSKSSSNGDCGGRAKQVCRVLPMVNSRRQSLEDASATSVGVANTTAINSTENAEQIPGTSQPRKKICMKRNYKTVIKKYPLRSSARTNKKPYQTVQIEINETIEIPEEAETSQVLRKSVKRKWNAVVESDVDEEDESEKLDSPCRRTTRRSTASRSSNNKSEATFQTETDVASVSKKIVKFSDDNNDITVSIVNNNNVCNFVAKPRVQKYRHKTLLQVDGAASVSSCSDGSDSDLITTSTLHHQQNSILLLAESSMATASANGVSHAGSLPATSVHHDNSLSYAPSSSIAGLLEGGSGVQSALAIRIKEQSLAHSAPGDEGPYKCDKCRRLYR